MEIKISETPTLDAIDKILEENNEKQPPRLYLGMSQIGEDCQRKLFYSYRKACKRSISASGLKAINDGFVQEDIMASRLRLLPYIELYTVDPNTDKQIGFDMLNGHFKGHCDGVIKGILEAPKTWHVWEHKSVNDKKFSELVKLKNEDEKTALEKWDYIYYSQAQIYMNCLKFERHFLTVTTPGGRAYTSVRTNFSQRVADNIIEKAKDIIHSKSIPARLSDKPEYYKCKWCEFSEICHYDAVPQVSCFTCQHIEPIKEGQFYCNIKKENCRKACENHLFNPALVPGELVESASGYNVYKLHKDGSTFCNAIDIAFPSCKSTLQATAIFTSLMLKEKETFKNLEEKQEKEIETIYKKWL